MQLYAIEYVHNPVAESAYRKIRAAVIGEELFITHVHFGPRWNVHRERDREKLSLRSRRQGRIARRSMIRHAGGRLWANRRGALHESATGILSILRHRFRHAAGWPGAVLRGKRGDESEPVGPRRSRADAMRDACGSKRLFQKSTSHNAMPAPAKLSIAISACGASARLIILPDELLRLELALEDHSSIGLIAMRLHAVAAADLDLMAITLSSE